MPSAQGWVWERPSKLIIPAILLLIFINITPTCKAESQNTTLSEVSAYNFTNGFYQIVKYQQDGKNTWMILQESDIPYLNISYTAPKDGFLDIYIDPVNGPFPYIELDDYWEINTLTYSRSLGQDETVNYFLTPPLIFADYNSSRTVGLGITLWEMYTWPPLSGLINYTFTSTDEITFDLISHPSDPRQGDEISLFTRSNADIFDITWEITGNDFDWVNNSQVLEIENLIMGEYYIRVTGLDEFNNSHHAEAVISVQPPVHEYEYFDINLFSINYPESITLGEIIEFKAIIDYSVPTSTQIKCVLSDTGDTVTHTENQITLEGDGSSNFNHYMESTEPGVLDFMLRVFYNQEGNWVEVDESTRVFTVTVEAPTESRQIPGFNPISLITGLTIIVLVNYMKNQKYSIKN